MSKLQISRKFLLFFLAVIIPVSIILLLQTDFMSKREKIARSNAAPQNDYSAVSKDSQYTDIGLTENEKAWLKQHTVITVAQDAGWPPVEFVNEKGEQTGMTHDYLLIIEKKLDVKFEVISNLPWSVAYQRMKNWEIDMTTSVSVTTDRLEFWAFTKPYMEIPIVMVTKNDVSYINNMQELSGKKIAVVDGYAIVEWLAKDYPQIELVKVKDVSQGLQLVNQDFVFAFADNMLVMGYYMTKLKMNNLKIAGTTPYINAQCMAVRKDWPILASILDKALASITVAERDSIYSKWVPVRYEFGFEYGLFWRAIIIFSIILAGFLLYISKLSAEIKTRKNIEADLRRSKISLTNVIDGTNAGTWEWDITTDNIEINEQWGAMIGLKSEEMIPMSMDKWKDFMHPEDHLQSEKQIAKILVKAADDFDIDSRLRHADGTYVWVHIRGKVIHRDSLGAPLIMAGTQIDINERKISEENVKSLLLEKELLLREVHHRIKNNMNTIKGLLSLQISAEKNREVTESLKDAESRVQSMIMLYDRLYVTENYRELSVRDYINSLITEIIGGYPKTASIEIRNNVDDFILNVNLLTPLGIIVNELLTNMMKYAFQGRTKGVITLYASCTENTVVFAVQDDGNGLPEGIDTSKSPGFGLTLVGMLVEQMGGKVQIYRNNGTKFVFEFEEKAKKVI